MNDQKRAKQEEYHKEPSKEDEIHDKDNKITLSLSQDLQENIANIESLFENCTDVVKREVDLGTDSPIKIYGVYIDGMVNRDVIENFFLARVIDYKNLRTKELEDAGSNSQIIIDHFAATFDLREAENMDAMVQAVLAGEIAIFVDNSKKGIILATRAWPVRGIGAPETESVVRGPRDGFVETIRFNTALIRRRIRDTKLKVEMLSVGTRSRTDIAVMYMDDIVHPSLVTEVKERLNKYTIDGVFDSGMVEQLIEDSWKSSFPQTQATERPDKVASSLMEGKVAIVVDTSPFVIVVPTTLNTFFQASEDYYQRWQIMSFTRVLRYIISFLAFALPGIYIAVLNFHPQMLPTTIAVSLAASREGIAFTSVLEIIIMEVAFELLREAGIRSPSAIGHTIGLVGGIIIGQSAVEAKIISPMVVIIVALTALATFAIPDYGLTAAFRLLRYGFIIICAVFGMYGFFIGCILLVVHLASLESFHTPFLAPYVGGDSHYYRDMKDALFRFPTFMHTRRPREARSDQRTRLRLTKSDSVAQTPPGPDSEKEPLDESNKGRGSK